jgi:hypothetical protein
MAYGALWRLWLDYGRDRWVRPQAPRFSAAGHPKGCVPVLFRHLSFQLALDVLDGAFDGKVGCLGGLMTDQRRSQRSQLDAQSASTRR